MVEQAEKDRLARLFAGERRSADRRAHSKSEFKRLAAQGAILPSHLDTHPEHYGWCAIDEIDVCSCGVGECTTPATCTIVGNHSEPASEASGRDLAEIRAMIWSAQAYRKKAEHNLLEMKQILWDLQEKLGA